MNSHLFASSPNGRVVSTRTGYEAYVPDPLPPSIRWDNDIGRALEAASLSVGALDSCLHDSHERYLPLLLRADAAESIRSEGYHVNTSDLLRDETRQAFTQKGSRLARNCMLAYEHGRVRMQEFPLSLRLVRELHYLLLTDVGDPRTTPGQFRRTQNWLGPRGCTLSTADFVPPPVGEMRDLLDNWERYLHTNDDTPSLVRLAIAHHQFMIIHPFLAMNGAAMALLAPLLLQHLGVTSLPHPFFGRLVHTLAATLQPRMFAVCTSDNWEEWLTWYLNGIADAARQTRMIILRLQGLEYGWQLKLHAIQAQEAEGIQPVLDHLVQRGAITLESTESETRLAASEAERAIHRLASLDIARADAEDEEGFFYSSEIVAILNGQFLSYQSTGSPL